MEKAYYSIKEVKDDYNNAYLATLLTFPAVKAFGWSKEQAITSLIDNIHKYIELDSDNKYKLFPKTSIEIDI